MVFYAIRLLPCSRCFGVGTYSLACHRVGFLNRLSLYPPSPEAPERLHNLSVSTEVLHLL
jgi:hypothetical protein